MTPEFVTREAFAARLGISRSTLYRWMRAYGFDHKRKLISPEHQSAILQKIGWTDRPAQPMKHDAPK